MLGCVGGRGAGCAGLCVWGGGRGTGQVNPHRPRGRAGRPTKATWELQSELKAHEASMLRFQAAELGSPAMC